MDENHKSNSGSNSSNSSLIQNSANKLPDYIRIIFTKDSHGRTRQLLIPAALDLDRPKRPRTKFCSYQIEAMEQEFKLNPFISEERRKKLADSIGITEMQVKVWMQNRRTKARKME